MMRRMQMPRVLPVTIAMLGVVLISKSVLLVRSAIESDQPAVLIASAWAAGHDAPVKPAEKSGGKHGEKAAEKPAAHGQPAKAGGESSTEAAGMAAPPIPEGPPPMTDSEKTVLMELRERRQELEAREATLAGRESMLVAAEKKVSARVDELTGLQQRLERLDASHRQQENTAWQGLVKVYETMKPRDAATIFNDLGMPVLLAVMDRMKEAKAAAILAAMLPDKARDVTTQLAQFRTNAATANETSGKPPLNPDPAKAPRSGT